MTRNTAKAIKFVLKIGIEVAQSKKTRPLYGLTVSYQATLTNNKLLTFDAGSACSVCPMVKPALEKTYYSYLFIIVSHWKLFFSMS